MVDAGDWQKLANALRELHRTLLEHARRDYERDLVVTLNPGEFLQLLTSHPKFAWLRSLSGLMVDIDLVQDAEPAQRDALASAVRAAVEQLITRDPANSFAQHYWAYVHDDPHVAMAHAGVKQAINAWPQPEKTDAASLLHERHRLAEKARHLSRRS